MPTVGLPAGLGTKPNPVKETGHPMIDMWSIQQTVQETPHVMAIGMHVLDQYIAVLEALP